MTLIELGPVDVKLTLEEIMADLTYPARGGGR